MKARPCEWCGTALHGFTDMQGGTVCSEAEDGRHDPGYGDLVSEKTRGHIIQVVAFLSHAENAEVADDALVATAVRILRSKSGCPTCGHPARKFRQHYAFCQENVGPSEPCGRQADSESDASTSDEEEHQGADGG